MQKEIATKKAIKLAQLEFVNDSLTSIQEWIEANWQQDENNHLDVVDEELDKFIFTNKPTKQMVLTLINNRLEFKTGCWHVVAKCHNDENGFMYLVTYFVGQEHLNNPISYWIIY